MKKISLCVPSYNRPETLRQLINSYQKQDYLNKELVISDDSSSISVKKLVEEEKDKTIKYFHNNPGLGFSRNLLESMKRASGDYIVLLGDDDILLNADALSSYVKIFEANPTVGFAYSNVVQFSDKLDIQQIPNFFSKDRLFKKGKESMENVWIRSIFIGGIGIRNGKYLTKYYPIKKILHPQVEFIGHILNQYDSYRIAKSHIGFRSHEDQIIFRALKNKKIRQEGKHMTLELFEIFENLRKTYNLEMDFDFAARQLVSQQLIMTFKEKSILGNDEMEKNYRKFCEISKIARNSKKLRMVYFLAKYTPPIGIEIMRRCALKLITIKNRKAFNYNKKILTLMTSNT